MASRQKEKFCPYCGNHLQKYFSVETCAKLCDMSAEFFRKKIRQREIGFVKIGKSVRIPSTELKKIIEEYPRLEDEVHSILVENI